MTTMRDTLALHGGTPVKTTPYGTGRRFDGNELAYLTATLEQNTLFYGFGQFVQRACAQMQAYTGLPHAVACSSGSAAVHLGLIAAGVGPGDEVITTPNTDMGTVIGILAEGAVPIFCDCERTLQPSAQTVAAQLTDRTRAVIVVHLAGYAAPVDEIIALCAPRGIAVIEDCAQAWGARLHGRMVGTFGLAGCYSTNDYKHLSTGEGGFVVLSDAALYRRVANYADKYYDRFFDGALNKHHFGLNYRMSELQGAVACAQLEQAEAITAHRHACGEQLRELCRDIPGMRLLTPIPDSYASDWWTMAFVDTEAVTVSRDALVEALRAEGLDVASYGRYDLIGTPLFQNREMRPWLADERRYYPFQQPDGRHYTYSLEQTPNHRHILATAISFIIGPFFTETDIVETAAGFRKVFSAFAR
jgi:perosamine synthetase